MNYKSFCKEIFDLELKNEGINNVKLKVLPLSFMNSSGFVVPNIEKSSYEIVINSSSYSKLNEKDKMFYTCVTLFHEIEHIKTFEKTKDEKFYDYEHFISLLEYITYLEKYNIPFNKINLGIKSRQIIMKALSRNYKVSSGELKCSLVGYEKARNNNLIKNDGNIDIILKSLRFLNSNMQLYYDEGKIPVDKFKLFIVKTMKYIKKYPELLKEYKILNNFFDVNGNIKEAYDIYLYINEENRDFYGKFLINLLSVSMITEKFILSLYDKEYKNYIEKLINNYNESIVNYFQNIKLGTIFIEDEKILYENLKILLLRSKNLNVLSEKCNIKKFTRMII